MQRGKDTSSYRRQAISTASTVQSKPEQARPPVLLRRAIIVFFVAGLVVLFVLQRLLFTSPSKWEFALHQKRYETLVQQVKQLNLKPGEQVSMRIDASLDPKSLRPAGQGSYSSMVGKVAVRRSADGSYQMGLITRDEGHAGAYGYLYSETPLHLGGGEVTGRVEAPGDLRFVREQIKVHWWSAYNDLF